MYEQCVKHILIAEDDDNLRQSLVFVLESAGYEVTAVDDGKYAMQQLMDQSPREEGFDLLITDLQMPRMLGLDLIGVLQDRNITMPVIVISGYSDKQTMIELIRTGCSDFLEKPFTPQKVLERVSEVSHKWFEVRQKQVQKEQKLQQQLNDLRRLLSSYEQRYAKIIEDSRTGGDTVVEHSEPPKAESLVASTKDDAPDAENPPKQAVNREEESQLSRDEAIIHAEVPLLLEDKCDNWLLITPQAHLSDEFTAEFCGKLAGYLDSGENRFRFDLSNLPDMGARVLAVFAALASTLQNTGKDYALEVSSCSEKIANLFRLTALNISYHMPS